MCVHFFPHPSPFSQEVQVHSIEDFMLWWGLQYTLMTQSDALFPCSAHTMLYPLSQQTSPWPWGVQPPSPPQLLLHQPTPLHMLSSFAGKEDKKRVMQIPQHCRDSGASYSGLTVGYLHKGRPLLNHRFHVGLEPSYPPPPLSTPVL